METLLFYIFSAALLFFAMMTVFSKNSVASAIFLVLAFFSMSGLFVLLHAFFLAAVQVLVYAGAVMVLFLFVIMLLNVPEEEKRKMRWISFSIGILTFGVLWTELILVIGRGKMDGLPPRIYQEGTTEAVGRLLFSKYLLPFEIASLLLLVAMIGVVVLSKKGERT